ncbi:MAG: MipA/OmpV family protein [Thermodesulfobacteriota bacterium]|nr:MipA/OmpV family protein [Thermodesulfobacteriota bacterium]
MSRSICFSIICIVAFSFNVIFHVNTAKSEDTFDNVDIWLDVAEDIDEAPGYEDPDDRLRNWAIEVGFVGGVSPDYEGSNDYEFGMGPNFSITWKDLIWFKGKSLGVNLLKRDGWTAGPLVTKSSSRDDDDNNKLKGLDDVDSSTEVGGFAKYRQKPFRFELDIRHDPGSGHEGTFIEAGAGFGFPFDKPLFVAMAQTTWASDNYMESFFGVSRKESGRSGLREFDADSGIKDIGIKLTSGFGFRDNWKMGFSLQYKRLLGDAADSPIVDDEDQFLAGMSIMYTWGSKKRKKKP